MSKEIELKFLEKLKKQYECRTIINEEEPYTLFCVSDFGKILGIKNIRENIKNSKTKKLVCITPFSLKVGTLIKYYIYL